MDVDVAMGTKSEKEMKSNIQWEIYVGDFILDLDVQHGLGDSRLAWMKNRPIDGSSEDRRCTQNTTIVRVTLNNMVPKNQ
ncbi:predicted protein [Sclerotinia sclerotiorum 1980 UF-70]|uniref:Uncharacterized protein n=1 Tax=Sclerotinia sclerotiorum (strain ATCC 18683 / 1980 / Ss-1) TaxID=665079 RepID=A7F9G6_SCLS1|nr:predicted protein [Sclerotinia sclerotiorum 1980 UF-70]EDO00377.1 predicted protein [Sclerotinia sclerotiorum 1980 UF-70]